MSMIQPSGVDPEFGRYVVPVCVLVEPVGTVIRIRDLFGTELEMTEADGWVQVGERVPMQTVVNLTKQYGVDFVRTPLMEEEVRRADSP